ncbi:hypothetical protein PBI_CLOVERMINNIE_81 [Gordonia phage CloverMinnie]|nr:hypothetical protein PBI_CLOVERMINNIE_81 [Gordonia phage CloverMinnie]
MHKNRVRAALASVAAGGLLAAGVIAGTGQAEAASVGEWQVARQWICSATDARVDLTYTNVYGNTETRNNTRLVGQRSQNGAVTCIYKDLQAGEYGGYVSTHISDEDGGYVSCALFVGGRKVAESSDNSDFYSWASCY